MLIALSAVASLCFVSRAQAEVDSASQLSQKLGALREAIALKAEEVREKKRVLDEIERQGKIEQSQIEMQIAKVEARVQSLKIEMKQEKDRQESEIKAHENQKLALVDDIKLLRQTIQTLPPIRGQERIEALDKLTAQLDSDNSSPLKGYSELISLLTAELDLGNSVGSHRQLLTIEGEERPVTLFHIGHSAVIFRSSSGELGYLRRSPDGRYAAVIVSEDDKKAELERLIIQAQKGLRVTQATVPISVSLSFAGKTEETQGEGL